MRGLGCLASVVLVSGMALARAEDRQLADVQAGASSAMPSSATIEQARQQVLDARYQSELPGAAGDGRAAAGSGSQWRANGELGDAERQAMRDTRAHGELEHGSSFMTIVLWGLVIVIGLLVTAWLANELARDAGDAELPLEADARAQSAATAAIIDRPLGDADELARRGAFADAIHTLLLRTLQELARSAAVQVAPAMTSREILARVPLLAEARDALSGLITSVEITHFGEAPASAADYDRCRQQFHRFAAAFRGGTPARREALAA